MTITVDDPGTLDTFSVDIDWGDGSGVQTITLQASPVGSQTFTLTHQYLDDNPTATPSDTYTISASVTDDDTGTDSTTTTVQVDNAAPEYDAPLEIDAIRCSDFEPGDPVTVSGSFTDVGTLDTHTVTIDWGDGTSSNSIDNPEVFTLLDVDGGGSGAFTAQHAYATGGIFNVVITTTDDDTGSVTTSTEAWVSGVRVDPTTGELQIVGTTGKDKVDVNAVPARGNGSGSGHGKGNGSGSGGGSGSGAGSGGSAADALRDYRNGGDGEGIDLVVKTNFTDQKKLTFAAEDVESIRIVLCEDDDKANVHSNVMEPSLLEGDGDDDKLTGGNGDDVVLGGAGDDKLKGAGGDDELYGGDGDDWLHGDAAGGGSGSKGGSGHDNGANANITFDDYLDGGAGDDTLIGGQGDDTLLGGDDDDKLIGGQGADELYGGAGDDKLFAGGSGSGSGGRGSGSGSGSGDVVFDDYLNGGAGDDELYGGAGNDELDGGDGDDVLQGNAGDDILTGGDGDDLFIFSKKDDADTITDFEAGAGSEDAIEISGFGKKMNSFDELLDASEQVGSDTVIDFGKGDSLTLIGVDINDLHQDDFIF